MAETMAPTNRTEDVRSWFARRKRAQDLQKKTSERYRWKTFIEEYKGHFAGLTNGAADIQINPLNFVFAYIKTEIPALYLRDPHIKINPKKGSSIESAKILEMALNYIWRKKKVKRENKKNILDALTVGHSWFKTGYTGQFGTVEDGNGNTIRTIESEDFFGYRVPWENIVFDPDAIDPPYDCKWIMHTVWVPLDDARNNPRYNDNRLKLMPMSKRDKTALVKDESEEDFDVPTVALIETWDFRKKRKFTISEGLNDYVEDPAPDPYHMPNSLFTYLNFNPANDDPYGLPDVYMFEPQILELTKLRAMMLDHIKRFNRQLLTTPQNFTQEMKDQLALGVTGALIEASDPTKVLPLPYPQIQTDIYAIEERIKEDMINISGQSPQERGATQKTTTRTFRELAQIARGAENRRSERIDLVESFVEEIAANFVALLQQFADMPYYVRVTGKPPEEIMAAIQSRPSARMEGAVTDNFGFTFTKEDIQGEFDVEVVAGSTAPLDKDNTIQTVLGVLELLPKIGLPPGSPIYGALGNMLADNLQMPELERAIEEEGVRMMKMAEQQAKVAQEATELQVAKETADTQIKAEREATRQNDTLIKAIQALKPQSLNEAGE